MIGKNLKLLVASAAVVAVVSAFWYVSGLRADLQQEQANNIALQQGIAEQQRVIDLMRRDFEQIQSINASLRAEVARQEAEKQALIDRFNTSSSGSSRDFGELAAEKPDAIQRIVNKAAVNAMRCLELASGAKHTEDELAATNKSEVNSECPALANPNYEQTEQ